MSLPYSTQGSQGQTVYSTGIASSLISSWLWDPSPALEQDPAMPEKLLKDPVIAGACDHLFRSVVGHSYSYEPCDPDSRDERSLAAVVEGLTRQTQALPQTLYNLARATFMSAAWGVLFPKQVKLRLGDGKEREWTVVGRVRDVDKRRFRLSRIPQTPVTPPPGVGVGQANAITSQGAGAQLGAFRWEFHRGFDWRDNASVWWGPLDVVAPNDRWMLHVPDTSERGLSYGYGLIDDLAPYFWMKSKVLSWGMQGLERWGQGFLLAQVEALRDGLAKGSGQANALQQTVTNIRKWRSENFAAVDADTKISLLDMPSTAEASCRAWIEYLDNVMRQRILAALQPTGSGDGDGGYSSAKVEEGSTDNMVAYLRGPLEETWTQTFVRFLIEHNQENLTEIGLYGLPYSRLKLRGKEHRDLDQVVKLFEAAMRMKIPTRLEDWYSMTGMTAPNDEDHVIVWPEVAVPGQPMDGASPFDREPVGEGDSAVADAA